MLPNLYDQLGAEQVKCLVEYFYEEVFANEALAHLFDPSRKDEIKSKQELFLTQFLGGPGLYTQVYGHPRLRARHMPHSITQEDAIQWLACMSKAVSRLNISEELKDQLFERFPQTAMFMVNTESPSIS
ncbi:MAG: globin [Cytophagaceae bacterium]|jgi:hemoglobin|nr:globin [Cytophagaceae bacterium]